MQTSARPASGLGLLDSYTPLGGNQPRLYYALREAVPIIDAAIFKTVRLTGGFEVRCADERLQHKHGGRGDGDGYGRAYSGAVQLSA